MVNDELRAKSNDIGRNDPCPCGSGKKYKKCCMLKDHSVPGPQDIIRSWLISKLFEFVARSYKHIIPEAYDFFWNGGSPEETLPEVYADIAEINFHEWLLFDYVVDPDGYKTIVDLYRKASKNLSNAEKEMLDIFKNSVLSLYEVQEVIPEQGLILKDLLLDGEYAVKEKRGTHNIFKWDILATRLLLIDGQYSICGSVYPYPVAEKQVIIDAVESEYRDFKKDNSAATLRDCLKITGSIFNDVWYEIATSDRLPGIITKTGEPMMFCKSVFTVSDRTGVMRSLKACRELSVDTDTRYTWLEEPGTVGSTVLGTIDIVGKQLTLECMSKDRLKKGKELIKNILGDLVLHKGDTVMDPYEALESMPAGEKANMGSGIPKEIEQQFFDEFMHEHMTKWLDEKIPALDDKTPRECVKSKEGRQRVTDLLKSFENIEEKKKMDGRPYVGLKWVWQELGLKYPE
jgi:hypothetical protein